MPAANRIMRKPVSS